MLKNWSVFAAILGFTLAAPSSAQAYTWTQQCLAGGTPCGDITLAAPTRARGTATLPAAVTIAPFYTNAGTGIEHVYALSNTAASNGTDYELWDYIPAIGWQVVKDTGNNNIYLRGVVVDGKNGAGWGWTTSGDVWDNETSGWHKDFTGWTSVAVYDGTAASGLFASSNSTTCSGSGAPSGQCLEQFTPSGAWPGGTWADLSPSAGGMQIAMDLEDNNALAAVDSSGGMWGISGFGYSNLGSVKCAGGTVSAFDQPAVKGGYGILGLGSGGTVWLYGDCGTSNGWVAVGTKTAFAVSIATDNSQTGGFVVWATDSSGKIWAAN